MNAGTDPIARICVVSTGEVRMRPEHIGPTRQPLPLWLLTSRRLTAPRPISVYVIEHRRGLILFDTGQDRASITDPHYFGGRAQRWINARMGALTMQPHETLDARLAALGYTLDDVSVAVLSHLHPDHAGGVRLLRHTTFVVSADEWAMLTGPWPQRHGIYPRCVDIPGRRWKPVTPERLDDPALAPFRHGYDLMGDGSLIVLPTPGHTRGSQSLLVRRPGRPPLLMVGDLTYDVTMLAAGVPSGMCEPGTTAATMTKVNALRRRFPRMAVLPSHDPTAAARLAAVTG